MNSIDSKTIIVREKSIIASDMDGEMVMMSIETGKYYNLGKIGGMIWNLIETPILVSELIKLLIEKFEVDEKKCIEDTIPFLNQIAQHKLILIREEEQK